MTRTLIVCATILACWSPSASSQQPDPKSQVTSALQDAIRLLDGKQYVDFIKTRLRPNEVSELLTKYGTLDAAALEFAKADRPALMLKVLRAALKLEPTFTSDGTIARYRFDDPIDGQRGLSLQKIGDRWYLRD